MTQAPEKSGKTEIEMINPNKSPYHGVWLSIVLMILPSPILTLMLYAVLLTFQSHLSAELNLAAATALGFGVGSVYDLGCVITGALEEPFKVVKKRVSEFFADLEVSFPLAAKWWWNDVKTNGVAFWLELLAIALSFTVFGIALKEFALMYGWV